MAGRRSASLPRLTIDTGCDIAAPERGPTSFITPAPMRLASGQKKKKKLRETNPAFSPPVLDLGHPTRSMREIPSFVRHDGAPTLTARFMDEFSAHVIS